MKKIVVLGLMFLFGLSALFANSHVSKYDLKNFTAHIYTSGDPMGDVSVIIEGKDSVVMLEPQSFYKSVEDINKYIESLNKPLVKIIANYHFGGLANYNADKIVALKPMVEFMKSQKAQGMLKYFDGAFKGAMDTRTIEPKETIEQNSNHKFAGINFVFSAGASSDFPASSVNVGNALYYMHFSPNKMHPSEHQIKSMQSIDETLEQLSKALKANAKVYIGSHGTKATIDDVKFVIEYLKKMKQLKTQNSTAEQFKKAILETYPNLEGAQSIDEISKNLYK